MRSHVDGHDASATSVPLGQLEIALQLPPVLASGFPPGIVRRAPAPASIGSALSASLCQVALIDLR